MNFRRFAVSLLATAVVAAAFVTGGSAAPFVPEPFNDLRGELTQRRDNDYDGELDATEKKELKAILKAIKTLDKTSRSFSTDLKNAGKIVKGLAKAFPGEFGPEPQAFATLDEVASFMFNRLQDIVEEDLGELQGRVGGLSSKGQAKVGALVDIGQDALDGSRDTEYTDWQKALIAAYKAYLKGTKTADKDKPDTGGKQFLKATINGAKWESDADTRVATVNGQLVILSGTRIGLPAKNLSITPQAVTGTGTYTISIASYNELGFPTKSYQVTNAGTITFTVFDTVNLRIAGTFSFTANGVGGTTGSVNVEGSFDMTYVNGGV